MRFAIPPGAPRRRLFTELSRLPGVADVVLAEEIGCVVFERENSDFAGVRTVLGRSHEPGADDPGRTHTISVVYDGEDLEGVAVAIGRRKEDVIALHAGAEYRVAMLGFLPGFAYLGGLPSELRLPRRAPRPRVPAGSVAIAAEYTGIYPFASPGGWHLRGRAPEFTPFEPGGDGHAVLVAGDVVRFAPTSEEPPPLPRDTLTRALPSGPHIEITRAAGFALLVDRGRPGRMHEGVPPGGPLVRCRLARANAFTGNAPGECGIELSGTVEIVARGGSVVVADDVAGPFRLADGERHVVSTEGRARVRYLALAGGIDAPVVLGGRGSLLVAGIGGLLRKGTRLASRGAAPTTVPSAVEMPADAPIAITEGPDASPPLLRAIAGQELRIAAASDRTGTRLEGTAGLAASMTHQAMTRRSTPMVMGAIELTPSGLIVLGPDHPTTGGYPVVAVVNTTSLDRLFSKPIGASVRFVLT